MSSLLDFDIRSWRQPCTESITQRAVHGLEHGQILFLPHLGFELTEPERRFLSPVWSNGRSKNINLDGEKDLLKGAQGSKKELRELHGMMKRFAAQAEGLIQVLLPAYAPFLRQARTSFRPVEIEERLTVSYRQDDRRLHVDAFPSRPNHGERILRVFTNVNATGQPRVWKTGEPFEDMARRFLPDIPSPVPGSAWLLNALGITKGKRSLYDHVMLKLHDRLKQDTAYRQHAPQWEFAFPANSTWLVFSDQVLHAALSGRFLLEQTFHLPITALAEPETAPLRVLERLMSRPLT